MRRLFLALSLTLAWLASAPAQEPAAAIEAPAASAAPAEAEVPADQASWRERFSERTGMSLNGFVDARQGVRTQHDDYAESRSLNELRLQLALERPGDQVTWQLRGDFLADGVARDARHLDLDRGQGWFDLREANAQVAPTDWLDLKLGRQILTWGTGNMLFINDLFPKDWEAFFAGRDQEYLKAPSDAVLANFYSSVANLDLVWVPIFDSDRFITGERQSYYSPALGRRAGDDAIQDPHFPDDGGDDGEWHARLHRLAGPWELALYGYYGYWKSPAGMSAASGRGIFPRLSVYGASVRGPALDGIANAEFGYYDSRDDRAGDDPLVANGQTRWLLGYQRELMRDLSLGLQYYLEHTLDHEAYLDNLPAGQPAGDEDRHVLTLSLTQLLMQQNLILSLFAYYSPSDEDAYLRPSVSYKLSDAWLLTAGANVFVGRHEHTFFNQFEHNTNLYAGLRWSF